MHVFALPEPECKPEVVKEASDQIAPLFDILEKHLADKLYICGDKFTMGDIPAASLANGWLTYAPDRPSMPNLEA